MRRRERTMCKNFKPFSLLAGLVFYGVTNGLGIILEKAAENSKKKKSPPKDPLTDPSGRPTH